MGDKIIAREPIGGVREFINFEARRVRFSSTEISFGEYIKAFGEMMDAIREECKDGRYSVLKILTLIAPEGDLYTPVNERGQIDRRRAFLRIDGTLIFAAARELCYHDMKYCPFMGYDAWIKKAVKKYDDFHLKDPLVDIVMKITGRRDSISIEADEKEIKSDLEKIFGKDGFIIVRDEDKRGG
jgi:hypothetical protein